MCTAKRLEPFLRLNLVLVLLSLVFLLSIEKAAAQANYQPGYVVIPGGDTLKGWINDRTETKNAQLCAFKSSPQSNAQKYGPETLIGYGFSTGKMYESRRVRIDSTTWETFFLELLVKGDISLFHLKIADRYFIEKLPLELQELYQVKQTVEKDGSTYVVVNPHYKGTLIYLTLDCPRLKDKIDRLPFEHNDLFKLVREYNHCKDSTPSLQTRKKFVTVKGGLLGGINQSQLRFISNETRYEYLTQASLAITSSPFVGFYLQTTFPWVTQRLTFWLETQYSRDYYKSYRAYKKGESTYREDVSVSRKYLRFPAMFRYTYPTGKLRPFAQAGVRLDIAFSKGSSFIRERELFNTITRVEQTAIEMRNAELGGLAGAGLEFQVSNRYRLFTELRGSLGNGMVGRSSRVDYKSRTNSWSIQFGLGF